MTFTPQEKTIAKSVPYFHEAKSTGGWQGQSTSKSVEILKSEIITALSRLGALIEGFSRGTFDAGGVKREGFQILYAVEIEGGKISHGRIDIASLPVKKEADTERSLRMALYMFRNALDGQWFMQQLSPGYSPLMAWSLTDDGRTISERWVEDNPFSGQYALPEKVDLEIVEGEVYEQ